MALQNLFIDFETYYDNEYSLSKMTTAAYVMDTRFLSRGASVAINDGEAKWLPDDKLRLFLETVDWENTRVTAHNTLFDGFILVHRYGYTPAEWCDTVSLLSYWFDWDNMSLKNAARRLGLQDKGDALEATKGKRDLSDDEQAALDEYAIGDLVICRDIFNQLHGITMPEELAAIDMTIDMMMYSQWEADPDKLNSYADRLAAEKEERLTKNFATVCDALPPEQLEQTQAQGLRMFASAPAFYDLLMELNGEVPMKLVKAKVGTVNAVRKAKERARLRLGDLRNAVRAMAKRARERQAIYEARQNKTTKVAETDLRVIANTKKNIAKAFKAKAILFATLKAKDLKVGQLVRKPALAKTDEGLLELLNSDSDAVVAAVEARLDIMSSINETRARTLAQVATAMNRKIPTPLRYCGAHTNRHSGKEYNLQNLPSRGDTTIRSLLVPPPGYKLVVADLSQIEPRTLGYLSQCKGYIKAFPADGTSLIYETAAAEMYNVPVDEVTKAQRQMGKMCIAEGQLVLTDKGLVPIDKIDKRHLLWDGQEWVSHDGLVFKGYKEVITYDGLTATADHIVFTEDGREIPFGQAASEMVRLERTGVGRAAVRTLNHYIPGNTQGRRVSESAGTVRTFWNRTMDVFRQRAHGKDKELHAQREDNGQARGNTRTSLRCDNSSLSDVDESDVPSVRGARNTLRVLISDAVHSVLPKRATAPVLQGAGDRSDRQQRELRAGESTAGYSTGEHAEHREIEKLHDGVQRTTGSCASPAADIPGSEDGSTGKQRVIFSTDSGTCYTGCCTKAEELEGNKRTVRVYDIINAGPRNRFTVEGRLVHNCVLGQGYGMGWRKFISFAKTVARAELSEEESKFAVNKYRSTFPEIPDFWALCDDMIPRMARYKGFCHTFNGIQFRHQAVILPSGRFLRYDNLHKREVTDLDEDGNIVSRRMQWLYGDGATHGLYGGLFVENLVQALSRDVIVDMALEVRNNVLSKQLGELIVNLVHDEIVCVVREDRAEAVSQQIKKIMSTTPHYLSGMPLSCTISIVDNYAEAK